MSWSSMILLVSSSLERASKGQADRQYTHSPQRSVFIFNAKFSSWVLSFSIFHHILFFVWAWGEVPWLPAVCTVPPAWIIFGNPSGWTTERQPWKGFINLFQKNSWIVKWIDYLRSKNTENCQHINAEHGSSFVSWILSILPCSFRKGGGMSMIMDYDPYALNRPRKGIPLSCL